MTEIKLKKASMAFELKSGEILLISEEDVNEIATKLILEMSIRKQNQVWMLKNTDVERCNLLYKIVLDQKDTMSQETREKYLNTINELLKNGSHEFESLEDILKK